MRHPLASFFTYLLACLLAYFISTLQDPLRGSAQRQRQLVVVIDIDIPSDKQVLEFLRIRIHFEYKPFRRNPEIASIRLWLVALRFAPFKESPVFTEMCLERLTLLVRIVVDLRKYSDVAR